MNLNVKCIRIKLKPDSIGEVEKWADTLNRRKAEVVETMEKEGIFIESVFLDKVGGDDYLIYYVRAEDFEKSSKVVESSELDIDKYHKTFKKNCWESGTSLQKLLDVSRMR